MKTQQNTYFTGLQVLTCKDSNGKHTNRQKTNQPKNTLEKTNQPIK